MPWLQLRLDCNRDDVEELEDSLLELGAAAVTLEDSADQPLYEPGVNEQPIWDHTRVSGLFDATIDTDLLLVQLQARLGGALPPARLEILEDKDWERAWMDQYQPIACGQRLWICPSWREPVDPAAINLRLDPGLAFGTGTHPTTRLCLQWLDHQTLNGKRVVDYGCGSGILGIAALLLGAGHVVAVDNDPQALLATRDNLQRNDLGNERLEALLPQQTPDTTRCDILLANILAGPLSNLAPLLAQYLEPGGFMALSGILSEQTETVTEAYGPYLANIKVTEKEGWVCISGQRTSKTAPG